MNINLKTFRFSMLQCWSNNTKLSHIWLWSIENYVSFSWQWEIHTSDVFQNGSIFLTSTISYNWARPCLVSKSWDI